VPTGEHTNAVTEIAPVLAVNEASAGLLYDAGCVYARGVAAVSKDARLATADRDRQAEAYARQGVALLRRAIARGYSDLKHLQTGDPALGPITIVDPENWTTD
jgi:hypothetical protein